MEGSDAGSTQYDKFFFKIPTSYCPIDLSSVESHMLEDRTNPVDVDGPRCRKSNIYFNRRTVTRTAQSYTCVLPRRDRDRVFV